MRTLNARVSEKALTVATLNTLTLRINVSFSVAGKQLPAVTWLRFVIGTVDADPTNFNNPKFATDRLGFESFGKSVDRSQ